MLEDVRDVLPVSSMIQKIRDSHVSDVVQTQQTLIHVNLPGSSFSVPLLRSEGYDTTIVPSAGKTLLAVTSGVPRILSTDVIDVHSSDPQVTATFKLQEISDITSSKYPSALMLTSFSTYWPRSPSDPEEKSPVLPCRATSAMFQETFLCLGQESILHLWVCLFNQR